MYTYFTCCVNADGDSIQDMIDVASDIEASTFFRHVSRMDVYDILGGGGVYSRKFPIIKDWHVRYHKSKYQGKPCYYVVWSCIEFVFIKG